MNIKCITDEQLHQNLINLKSKEDRIVAHILAHLEEVYRRRLFADHKCSSLYDYCVRILGYSNGEAHRKISACKLASQCEGIKNSIASGELSLSNAASVQTFLNQTQKLAKSKEQDDQNNKSEKKTSMILNAEEIVERVKNKSTRECEKELQKIAEENQVPAPAKISMKRNIGDKTQLKIELDRDQLALLKTRLGVSCEQTLLQMLIEEKLKATEPKTDVTPKPRKNASLKPRSISPSKKAVVFKRAQKKCENCGSHHHLEVDHVVSVARGGGNDIQNLRLLCRSCNQRAGIQQLGQAAMNPFLNPLISKSVLMKK